MLITAENDLERTIEIYILTIDIRCAIIRLELADACLDHADAHHKTGIPLDNGLKVIVTFQNHFGKQLRKRMIQIIPLRTAEVKQYRMILAEMIKLEDTMCQRLERLFERDTIISHGLPLRNAAESVEHDTARKSFFRSLYQ